MFALVSARDLLTFFLGLELATLPLFALAGFQARAAESVEAAAKLMILAGMATAINLFGISLLYGASGGLGFAQLALAAANPSPLLGLGAFLVFGGLAFKLAVVPFQMWAPDVYEGSPTPVTAFLSVGSKAAGLAAMAALFFGPLNALRPGFFPIFATAAVASMVVGNLGAMRQENMRRFLAYSSIAQAGYFLLAFTGDAGRGQSALWFNLLVFGAANFALFFVIASIGPKRPETMPSFRGLSAEKPGLALLLLLSLFSLAGLPPLAGFLGKFLVISVAAAEKHYWLVFVALGNAVWSLYYYLRPVLEAYVSQPETPPLPSVPGLTWPRALPLWILAAAVLLLGIWPLGLEGIP
jgi:NADH-quinone oxidoreductase subunit N